MRNILVVVALLVAAMAGCAPIEKESRSKRLDQAVRVYLESIRWGNFDIAAGLLRRRDGSAAVKAVGIPAELRVTAYSSRLLSVNEAADEAMVAVSFDYYFPNSNKVRTVSRNDLWWFDSVSDQWYLDGTLPEFTP